MTGGMMSQVLMIRNPVIRTPVNFPFPRMQLAEPTDDEIPWTNARWTDKVSGSWISDQQYPLTIHGIDSKQLLDNWFWSFVKLIHKEVKPASPWKALMQKV